MFFSVPPTKKVEPSKTPLVCLHGYGLGAAIYTPARNKGMAEARHAYSLDVLGNGLSSKEKWTAKVSFVFFEFNFSFCHEYELFFVFLPATLIKNNTLICSNVRDFWKFRNQKTMVSDG